MSKVRRRTQAREVILQFLYCMDIRSESPVKDTLDKFFTWRNISDDEITSFVRSIVNGYYEHQEKIREKILPLIKNWTEDRLTIIDRNILRMASYELSFKEDVPFKVSINEAIDLGKKFSTKESGKFVNGILDEYARRYISEEKK